MYICVYVCVCQCGNMAREGLRTLVVGKRDLSEDMYSDFEVCNGGQSNSTVSRTKISRTKNQSFP